MLGPTEIDAVFKGLSSIGVISISWFMRSGSRQAINSAEALWMSQHVKVFASLMMLLLTVWLL